MLATFALELVLVLWVLVRYSLRNRHIRLVMLILMFLAIFQLSEFWVCGGLGLNALVWSRVGFAAITLLPVLGIHLVLELAGRPKHRLIYPVNLVAIAIAAVFLFVPSSINARVCQGNYIIFRLQDPVNLFYGYFYDGLLLLGAGLSLYYRSRVKEQSAKDSLLWSFIAYLIFMVPTGIVYWVNPSNLGLPSIMCGFAIFYALILVFFILPKRKVTHKKKPK